MGKSHSIPSQAHREEQPINHLHNQNRWGTSLQKTLIDSGLELIAVDRRFPPPHLRNAWENIQIMNIRELGHKMPEERKAEWAEKLEGAFKELQEKGRGFVHSPDMKIGRAHV